LAPLFTPFQNLFYKPVFMGNYPPIHKLKLFRAPGKVVRVKTDSLAGQIDDWENRFLNIPVGAGYYLTSCLEIMGARKKIVAGMTMVRADVIGTVPIK
jgi:hypothetical protein